ncbi:MAG: TonB-dependent receptor, partial [Candidatus Acidiferrales bacterium]
MDLPWNFHVNTSSAIRSALATSIFLDASGGSGEIFRSDVDGDGVTQDPLPGTNRGAFSRSVKANDLNGMITNFNNTMAGQLTPAGLALVQAGLFTEAQLQSLNATMQPIGLAPAGQVNNDSFFTTDLRLSNSIRVTERFTVEPYFEIFNVFNIANYQSLT